MKLKIINLFACLVCTYTCSYGQGNVYHYKRELLGVTEQWHKITLPDAVFGKISSDFSDIRIVGITDKQDTIEAPYLIRHTADKVSEKEVRFKQINTSYNDDGFYFTFEIPTSEAVNQINLDFAERNFDWRVKLEGSQNLRDWFTITNNYRILAIQNGLTDFQFTKLVFPDSKYRYFRVSIDSKEQPSLTHAGITHHSMEAGIWKNHVIRHSSNREDKTAKQTLIDIELPMPVSVNQLKIAVKDTFDYYRPISFSALCDSTHTSQGWRYNYRTLTSGVLHSLENAVFNFEAVTTQKLKISIHNHDNQPLNLANIEVRGNNYELVARFTTSASYFLTYGNPSAVRPNYDIDHFADKVPKDAKPLTLGEEISFGNLPTSTSAEPLFKNKAWLWAVMSLIILVLGWFTLRMMGGGNPNANETDVNH